MLSFIQYALHLDLKHIKWSVKLLWTWRKLLKKAFKWNLLSCDFYGLNQSYSNSKKKKKEKKNISSHNIFLLLFGLQLSRRIVIIVYMRCTCIVHNIFFLLCVERLKVLTLCAAISSEPVFGQQVVSLCVVTDTSTVS